MKQEDKELLLKDLCARLPYGVKVLYLKNFNHEWYNLEMVDIGENEVYVTTYEPYANRYAKIEEVKPYLFPLSSMTEEQYHEMQTISGKDCLEHMEVEKEWRNNSSFSHLPLYEYRVIDFFIKNHFDYRGLIEKGLAIDATELNIY